MTTTEYRAGLSAEDIDGELEALVDTKRCCEWLLCPEAEPAAAGGAGACASATDGLSDQASQVLRAMGGRGGWSTDSLVDETGMKVQLVSVALLELELSARIRSGPPGTYSPAKSVLGRGDRGLQSCKMDAPRGTRGRPSTGRPRRPRAHRNAWP